LSIHSSTRPAATVVPPTAESWGEARKRNVIRSFILTGSQRTTVLTGFRARKNRGSFI
jgi:hypothetical protein